MSLENKNNDIHPLFKLINLIKAKLQKTDSGIFIMLLLGVYGAFLMSFNNQ